MGDRRPGTAGGFRPAYSEKIGFSLLVFYIGYPAIFSILIFVFCWGEGLLFAATLAAIFISEVMFAGIPLLMSIPLVAGGSAGAGSGLIAAAILVASIVLASLIIYRLDASHSGRGGAIRWTAAGALYGLLQPLMLTPISSDFDFTAVSSLKPIGGDLAWKVAALVPAYAVVFPIASFMSNRFQRSSRDIPFSH